MVNGYAQKSGLILVVESLLFLLVSVVLLIGVGWLTTWYMKQMDHFFTWNTNPYLRLFISFTLIVLSSFFFPIFILYYFPLSVPLYSPPFWASVLGLFAWFSLIYTIEETYTFVGKNAELRARAEKLAKEQNIAKYEALKKQINPHFLFNCFNILAELVHDDSDKADNFLAELSKIYRYVLDQNKDIVVSLRQELEFIQSFIYLHQIRFEDKLIFQTNIPQAALNYVLPPLSLELLVENAIKHNKITEASPLKIEIIVDKQTLIVKNNFQPRTGDFHISKIGLKNLEQRYHLICDRKPNFEIENGFYVAKIPLLTPDI